jgi:ERCC4-type nuclease
MTRAHLDLRPEDLTIIIDTREQRPLDLALRTERATLTTGDYSVKGLEHLITAERKSLDDLVSCVGQNRERFERTVQRMLAYEARLIVVEAPLAALEVGEWRAQVTPSSVQGSVAKWQSQGLPILFADNRQRAALHLARWLYVAARERWRRLQSFIPNLKISGGNT